MEITPIKKSKLNDEVFQQMKNLLIDGVWKPGERIPSENALAEQFNVSRITVRQALQNLTTLGLIETKPGKGRFVCVPDAGRLMQHLVPTAYLDDCSVRQVNEFREMLDTWSARLAATRATEADIAKLEQNYALMVRCSKENNWQEFAVVDLAFHIKIGQITQNPLICSTYTILYEMLHSSIMHVVERMGYLALDFHRQLIDAIAAHDVASAERIARLHVENNREYIGGIPLELQR